MIEAYAPSPEHDALLLQWWGDMMESGDINKVFSPDLRAPSIFLSTFKTPTVLYFEQDEKGIATAVWFAPALNGAMLSLWARKDWRGGKWRPAVIDSLKCVFEIVPIVLFVTRGEHVVKAAQEMGFTLAATIPYIYMGEEAALGYMTKETFGGLYG